MSKAVLEGLDLEGVLIGGGDMAVGVRVEELVFEEELDIEGDGLLEIEILGM